MSIETFTIYKNPSDAPGMYVVRQFVAAIPLNAIATPISDAALQAVRDELTSLGLTNMGRQPEDDPVILETWM